MYYIGLNVHKWTISYYVQDAAVHVYLEGQIGSTWGGRKVQGIKRRGSLQEIQPLAWR
jgi:hypothetical protein